MAKIHLSPLDPSREMVAQTAFLCRGKNYHKGERFEVHSVPRRTLRLLYEGWSIGYPEDQPKIKPVAAIVRTPPAAPASPPETAADRKAAWLRKDKPSLLAALRAKGVTVDARWGKPRLVDELLRFENAAGR